MTKKKNLVPMVEQLQYECIPLDQLHLSSMNPRKTYDENALNELAESIKAQGLLQPIIVRPILDSFTVDLRQNYEIICGSRRYKAMQLLESEAVPSFIRDMDDDEAFDAMITENLQRKDVEPLEESAAYLALQERGLSVADMAVRFGKSERYVRDRIKLNGLIQPFKDVLAAGKLSLAGALMIARLDEAEQVDLAQNDIDLDDVDFITASDVKFELSHKFFELERASFMPEDWNTDGKVRLCSACAANSACQQSLWPELADNAKCAEPSCYWNKVTAYVENLIEKSKSRLLPAHTDQIALEMAPKESMILYCERPQSYWDDERKLRTQALIDRYKNRYLILFDSDVRPIWNDENEVSIKSQLESCKIIEGLNLTLLADGRKQQHKYFTRSDNRIEMEPDDETKKKRLLGKYDNLNREELSRADELLMERFTAIVKNYAIECDDPLFKVVVASCARDNFYDDYGQYKTAEGVTKELDTLEAIDEWWLTFQERPDTPIGFALTKFFKVIHGTELFKSVMASLWPDSIKECADQAAAEFLGRKQAVEDDLAELGYDTKGDPLPPLEHFDND